MLLEACKCFLPQNPLESIAIVVLAHVMECLYPYHTGVMLSIHPVHTAYVLALRLGKPYSTRLRGVLTWFAVIVLHLSVYGSLLYVSCLISRILWIVVSAYIVKVSMSLRLLLTLVNNVRLCIEKDDLDCARRYAQHLVRRDVYVLGKRHVASAAIESLAESLVDGYTSPMLYYAIAGPLGALFQRLVNTMDSALGYKHNGFRDVGWFSAKMDTVVNFVPARLTAMLIVLHSFVGGRRVSEAYRIWRRDYRKTESVNAGHPMAAMAGALGVELEKPGFYRLGDPVNDVSSPEVMRRGIVIALLVAITFTSICIALNIALITTLL
jgi:adenosylcobinamide-phosphate synthase